MSTCLLEKMPVQEAEDEVVRVERRPIDHVRIVLIRARELVNQGWCQGQTKKCGLSTFYRRQYCILGGIYEAAKEEFPKDPYQKFEAVDGALRRFRHANNVPRTVRGDIPVWNDAKERKKAEVLAAFDNAIDFSD